MELIKSGLVLLVAGMGIVFVFLGLLVIVTNVTMRFFARFNNLIPDTTPKPKAKANPVAASDEAAIALAIAVARAR